MNYIQNLNDPENREEIDPLAIRPLWNRIFVACEAPEEAMTKKTKGGIILPDQQVDSWQMGVTFGYIVSMGNLAFAKEDKPTIGTVVHLDRYAGQIMGFFTKDEKKYVLLNISDTEVLGVVVK